MYIERCLTYRQERMINRGKVAAIRSNNIQLYVRGKIYGFGTFDSFNFQCQFIYAISANGDDIFI